MQPRIINGSHTLRAGNGSENLQYLIVNGELTVAPDAAPALKNLAGADKQQGTPMLYDLTELQRDANKLYGYSPKQTLNIMQKL